MPQSTTLNRRIVLNAKPRGAPTAADFRIESDLVPTPEAGQVLLRTLYLSLDPYMRGRMSDGPSYAAPVAIGDMMVGGTVSRVEASRHGNSRSAIWCWVTRAGRTMRCPTAKVSRPSIPGIHTPRARSAYWACRASPRTWGCWTSGAPWPARPSSWPLPVGRSARWWEQIAKIKGCTVVGIAGGDDKCRYVVDELGFDFCVDHRADDLPGRLAAACPKGIDVYFENVGGAVFDAVLPMLNAKARIPVCGLIAAYNATALPPGPDRLGLLVGTLLRKRIKMQGFIVFDDYGPSWSEFAGEMGEWVQADKVKVREDIVFGLENAPEAFIGLLDGKNFGKLIIQVAHE